MNISWGKTVGNWGANADLDSKEVEKKEEKKLLSFEELNKHKSEIQEMCEQLIQKSSDFYDNYSNKELYDALIDLDAARRSLGLILLKEPEKVEK